MFEVKKEKYTLDSTKYKVPWRFKFILPFLKTRFTVTSIDRETGYHILYFKLYKGRIFVMSEDILSVDEMKERGPKWKR